MTKTPPKPAGREGGGPRRGPVRVVSVSSGKGGVGKSNLTLALAYALTSLRRKVLIWDADLGLANTDVLLGIHATHTIHDWLKGEKALKDIIIEAPGGVSILPAASGILELSEISRGEKSRLLQEFEGWTTDLDFLLIDTAAGIGQNVVFFNLLAPEHVVVLTNEPTSITDAYALIKALAVEYSQKSFYVLPNMVEDLKDAKGVFRLISDVAGNYLSDVSLEYIGYVPRDKAVPDAVRRQVPFYVGYPQSEAAKKVTEVARNLAQKSPPSASEGGLSLFLGRLGLSPMAVG